MTAIAVRWHRQLQSSECDCLELYAYMGKSEISELSACEVGALTHSRVVRGEKRDTAQIKVPKPVMLYTDSLYSYRAWEAAQVVTQVFGFVCDGWWPRGPSAVERHLRREGERYRACGANPLAHSPAEKTDTDICIYMYIYIYTHVFIHIYILYTYTYIHIIYILYLYTRTYTYLCQKISIASRCPSTAAP